MKLRSEGLSWREIDGETVILDLQSSKYLRTNSTGTFLLKRLLQEVNRATLVDDLASAYRLSPDQAAHDVDEFLRTVADQELLVVSDHEE